MSLEPFVRRELVTSARSGGARRARCWAAALVLIGFGLTAALWFRRGWDRSSIRGAGDFGLASFAVACVGLILLAAGRAGSAAARVAAERDKRTLDVLLATRFSSAEVVLGAFAAEFVRFANATLAALPCLVLLVVAGGVASAVWVAAAAGLVATWYVAVAMGLAASVVSRTSARAASAVSSLLLVWFFVPTAVVVLKPLLWRSGPAWIVGIGLFGMRTSPMGLAANLAGLAPFGSWLDAVSFMCVAETLIGTALLTFAVVRLRPGSRAANDSAVTSSQAAVRRLARLALGRLPRPPCGDDPVYWNTAYADRPARIARYFGRLIAGALLAVFVLWLRRFAWPAFVELAKHGYGAFPGVGSMPDPDPLVLAMLAVFQPELDVAPAEGMARLTFNVAIRQLSAGLLLVHTFGLVAQVSRSITEERRRETWLGLLATPLSGREILWGKFLGSLFVLRWIRRPAILICGLGLAAGELHPLGFLAGLLGATILSGIFASMAFESTLAAADRPDGAPNPPLRLLAYVVGWVIVLPVVPWMLAYAALLSHEDVAHAGRTGRFLFLKNWAWMDARTLASVGIAGLLVGTAGLVCLARRLVRNFDAMVGRPTRSESSVTESSSVEPSRPAVARV